MAAAISLSSDGVVVAGTVESISSQEGGLDNEYPVVWLAVDRTYAGQPDETVAIMTADPLFTMEVGGTYLAFLARESAEAPYAPVDTYLFDQTEHGWEVRQGDGEHGDVLTLSDDDVSELIDEGQEYLSRRLQAGRAVMHVEPGSEDDQVVVSGYAAGETVEVRICAADDGFNPKTDASLRCGSGLVATITPDDASFSARYSLPEHLDLPDGTTVGCADGGCVLVVYDAGWPDKVFAIYRGR